MADSPGSLESKVEAMGVVGRRDALRRLSLALKAGRHLLVEGPVGVGKTVLIQSVSQALGRGTVRVDGDGRYTEQKLLGWFDPAQVVKLGFGSQSFVPGPLVRAMTEGQILFINELNRMPEAVQNILLPAMDEGLVYVPQFGEIRAKAGFQVLATQNPREFVATAHLSEALMDRMEWVYLDYQSFEEECEIVRQRSRLGDSPWVGLIVGVVRATRSSPKVKRGASIRAALAAADILAAVEGQVTTQDIVDALTMGLATRLELNHLDGDSSYQDSLKDLVVDWVEEQKKK